MWLYTQSDGSFYRIFPITPISVTPISKGYSGNGQGRNNPDMQHVKNVGPLPQGRYMIGDKFNSAEHGPECLPLVPDAKNVMFDRSGFLIHGDSTTNPGCASQGCLILPRIIRDLIVQTNDRELRVLA